MPKMASSLARYPARVTSLAFLALIAIGALLLRLPACSVSGRTAITWLDACFTSTSAVCVTGLGVRSTVDDFSFLGQLVILCLIQLGGIGIMTFTSFIILTIGGAAGLRQQALMGELMGNGASNDVRSLLRRVFVMSAAIELVGAAILWVRFAFDMPWERAGWYALFHSVSAFCNAGFALWNDSLIPYQADWTVNLVLMGLVILGGLGFPVLNDVLTKFRWRRPWDWEDLSLHSKIVLLAALFLIGFGYCSLSILEWDNALKDVSLSERILIPLFQSVIFRTAGFNSIDMNELTNASLFIAILLMAIGGAPCSTAGGVKMTTAALLAVSAVRRFQGYRSVSLFRRTISQSTVDRAMATALIFSVAGILGGLGLMMIEQSGQSHRMQKDSFLDLMFEVTSALGTVGLSTGITPNLSAQGKIIIMMLMFLGRLGPVSVMVALSRTRHPPKVEFAHEEPLVG
jgi:trk system potassium uptake protein